MTFDGLYRKIIDLVAGLGPGDFTLQAICDLLKQNVSHYDWVGFYLVDPDAERELVLGPFSGAPTDHVRIAFGQGICGQAAEQEKTWVVQDVSEQTNYLSCSLHVKSEIVVPIFKNGTVIGEIDIDSHTLSPFTQDDSVFLERIAVVVSGLL
jgi:L-methionine (R)-S-oxide reductase